MIESYSVFFLKAAVGIFVICPLLGVLATYCSRSSLVRKAVSFMFFNGTARIFIEMYIDICLEVFLNGNYL